SQKSPSICALAPEPSPSEPEKRAFLGGESRRYTAFTGRNEHLGRAPRADRDQDEPAQLLHVVPADVVSRRGPVVGDRAGAERDVQGVAHQALLGGDRRSGRGAAAIESGHSFRGGLVVGRVVDSAERGRSGGVRSRRAAVATRSGGTESP